MKFALTWLFPAVIFGGALIYGLVSGKMPARGYRYDRLTEPSGYWFSAAIWGGFTAFFIYKAVTG